MVTLLDCPAANHGVVRFVNKNVQRKTSVIGNISEIRMPNDSKTSRIDASIPLPLVSRKILRRFLALKDIQKKDASVLSYQELLDKDFSKKWENLRRKKPIQEPLMPPTGEPQGSLL